MEAPLSTEPRVRRRVGVYGWGVVAPGARDVAALEALLRSGRTAPDHERLVPSSAPGSSPSATPTSRSRTTTPGSRRVTATPTSRGCARRWARTCSSPSAPPSRRCSATRASSPCCASSTTGARSSSARGSATCRRATGPRRRSSGRRASGTTSGRSRRIAPCAGGSRASAPSPAGAPPPLDPASLPVDSEERVGRAPRLGRVLGVAVRRAARSFSTASARSSAWSADDEDHEKAHLNAIRKRVRAHRALVDEMGCPPPPWTAVSPNLIWNIQNAPAAQITMLLDVHGAAWAPVGRVLDLRRRAQVRARRDPARRGQGGDRRHDRSAARRGARERVSRGPRHAGHRRGEHALHVAAGDARLGRVVRLDHRRRRLVRGAGSAPGRRLRRGRRPLVGRGAHHHAVEERAASRHRARLRGGADHRGRRGRSSICTRPGRPATSTSSRSSMAS